MRTARCKSTGKQIVGTLETMTGVSGIVENSWFVGEDGSLQFDHDGGTSVSWESQFTQTDESGYRIFVDEDDNQVTEKDVELVEVKK